MHKWIFTFFAAFFPFFAQSLEYEIQLENDEVLVSKVKLMPKEEIGLHRDEVPSIVVALQGGTITRFEPNGSITLVDFPTGKAVYRGVDPEGEYHTSINSSTNPIELIIIQLKQG